MNSKRFLEAGKFILFTFHVSLFTFGFTQPLEFQGDYHGVHDPTIIQQGNKYYIFSTGPGIPIRCSDDLITWGLF
jgi:beta-xylosidase